MEYDHASVTGGGNALNHRGRPRNSTCVRLSCLGCIL